MPRLQAPGTLERTEDVMDLWAVLTTDDDGMRTHARDLLAPIMQQPTTEGREFDLAYAIPAWELAGGDPAAIDGLLSKIDERIDPQTGLITTHALLTGTLDSTYDVARAIPGEQFARIADDGTSEAVQALVPTMIENKDALGLLKAAFVLQQLGRAKESANASTVGRRMLEERVGEGPIPVSQIGLLVSSERVLDLLSQGRLEIGVRPFPVTDEETLFFLYSLIPYANTITNGQELIEGHMDGLSRLSTILENPQRYPVRLVVSALGAASFAEHIPQASVRTAFDHLESLRGCDGHAELFRVQQSDFSCVLPLSADVLQLIDARSVVSEKEGTSTP